MPNWEEIRKEWETSKATLVALAEKHGVKLGTLKSRKSHEGWSRGSPKKDATKKDKVTTPSKRMQPKRGAPKGNKNAVGNRGNPNPENQFAERNTMAMKHGFFSRYIPKETLEIMGTVDKSDPADLIWDQIQIQYAAIIRAQSIMFVTNKDEIVKEIKKEKSMSSDNMDIEETEWEIQFAWDRQAQFLNAQSRAISELRSSINQFIKLSDEADERRLKLEQMQLNIDKTKAEVENLTSQNNSHGGDDWVAALQEVAEKRKGKNDEQ